MIKVSPVVFNDIDICAMLHPRGRWGVGALASAYTSAVRRDSSDRF